MSYRQQKGLNGERLAAEYLEKLGFEILEHRYRFGHKEIDLIAQNGDLVVFVEVKNRCGEDYAPVELSVPERKRRNLIEAAQGYLLEKGTGSDSQQYRFDVILLISPATAGEFRLEHITDAFRL